MRPRLNPLPRIRKIIRELIGRTGQVYRSFQWIAPPRDQTRVDYQFWDKARRGKALGMEISGLLLKPVTSKIAAWAMGVPPQIKVDNPDGKEALNDWYTKNNPTIRRAYRESMDLADSYLVVNPDLSITIIPPNVIEPVVDPEDFSRTIGWKIRERWPHPTKPATYQTIEDIYTLTERTRSIYDGSMLSTENVQVYPNLLGRLPIVHIPNNTGSNQVNGTPECEAMAQLLQDYGEILAAGLNGNKLQGRPTPTAKFADYDALKKFVEDYGGSPITRTLSDGTEETYVPIKVTADDFLAFVGGEFKYAQPGPFAGETKTLLELLYFLILEHTELPEFVMGTAIASSKASAEVQMPIFERFIEMKRDDALSWIHELLEIVQGYMLLRGDITAIEEPTVIFESLTSEDGKLTLETLKWAVNEGLLDDETALTLAPITVENVAETIKKARQEQDKREQQRRDAEYQNILERTTQDNDDNDNADDTGPPVPVSSNGNRQPVTA